MSMKMKLFITRTLTDKNGKIVKKWRKRIAKSFVKAWMQYLSVALGHDYGVDADPLIIKDITGADRSTVFSTGDMNTCFCAESPSATVTYGILIGTGTTPPATADYQIETLIAEGAGAGQMNYGATSVLTAGIVATKMELDITRAIVNNSGGAITVKEVGLAIKHIGYSLLMVHDAVDDAVPNGQTYTVTYTIETTV